ncbi:MAG: arylsulfotransferase family protein [Acidobacteriota bacterium]
MHRPALTALALLSLAVLACGGPGGKPAAPAVSKARPVEAAWVTRYDPASARNGYTLTLHDLRIPILLDMNGRPVHAWRAARIKSRVRLLPDGSILGIGLGHQVVEYEWDGRQTWEWNVPHGFPHHDVIRLKNGNTLVLAMEERAKGDTLFEVTHKGHAIWTWRAAEHLDSILPPQAAHPNDLTHVNSLQELPENPWFAAGDARFRPGNLLLSARNLNTIFVVDRVSGAIVWSFRDGLDRQHEAAMNGPGLPEPGKIQVFNNRQRSFASDRQSEILEIDPRDGKVSWRYRAPGFFTPTGGLQQLLPNGNALITSTRGGRVFEITRAGKVVWEWTPPYEPVRAVRVARDACPQLAKIAGDPPRPVVPPAGYGYVDRDAYRFARKGARAEVVIEGKSRTVLAEESACSDLVLPFGARAEIGFGVDAAQWNGTESPPVFAMHLTPAGSPKRTVLLRETIGADGESWRRRTVPLGAYALRSVRLCVEIEGASGDGVRWAWWEQPSIRSAGDVGRAEDEEDEALGGDLTPEERKVQEQHLKSLGYVN